MGRIDIKGLSKSFGDVQALIDLNLVIEDGEFVALLGPSGCGKTTTLNMLAGFFAPSAGQISIDGVIVSEAHRVIPPEERNMGMVFQSYALWPHMSVFENVAYGLRRKKVAKSDIGPRVQDMLTMVGLAGYDNRHPGQLSGGQQQRVALARSLVTEPSMLLLDEPLSNLDAKLRDEMRYEIQQIQRRLGTTFVYVTHDQVEAMSISDRVAVLNAGRLSQYARPGMVYQDPADAFVADFMGLINFIPGEVVESGPEVGRLKVRLRADADCLLTVVASDGVSNALPGDDVYVAVRPEAMAVQPEQQNSSTPRLKGRLQDSDLLGNIIYHFVDIGDCIVRVQSDPRVALDVGADLWVEFDSTHVRAFAASEAAPFAHA